MAPTPAVTDATERDCNGSHRMVATVYTEQIQQLQGCQNWVIAAALSCCPSLQNLVGLILSAQVIYDGPTGSAYEGFFNGSRFAGNARNGRPSFHS